MEAITLLAVWAIAFLVAALFGRHDSLEQQLRIEKGDSRSLPKGVRVIYRSALSLAVGLCVGTNLFLLIMYSLVFWTAFHIPFDPIKNWTNNQVWHYMGISARYDRLCRKLDRKKPGRTALIIESIVLILLSSITLFPEQYVAIIATIFGL